MEETKRKKHPEMMDGEVFLGNFEHSPSPRGKEFDEGFKNIGFKSKRKGVWSYDIYGNLVLGLFPVFAKRKEVEESRLKRNKLNMNKILL